MNEMKKIVLFFLVVLIAIVAFVLIREGCAPDTYKSDNYDICIWVPNWKIYLFNLTGIKL